MQAPTGMVSPSELKLKIQQAQCGDPKTVTLPNACKGAIVQLDDENAFRVFSVSMNSPNSLPPDQWNLVKLPADMPAALQAQVKVNTTHILVDKITCGLLDGNELTTAFDENGKLETIVMCPPESCADPSMHWNEKACEFMKLKTKRCQKSAVTEQCATGQLH